MALVFPLRLAVLSCAVPWDNGREHAGVIRGLHIVLKFRGGPCERFEVEP